MPPGGKRSTARSGQGGEGRSIAAGRRRQYSAAGSAVVGDEMRGRVWLLTAIFAGGSSWAALAANSGNPFSDQLLALPESQRIEILATSVRHNCVGTRAFLMGTTASGRARGYAYWSVACTNGRSFVIQIAPDKKGTAIVEDCRILQGTGRECFTPF
jgi:hypothetical protein